MADRRLSVFPIFKTLSLATKNAPLFLEGLNLPGSDVKDWDQLLQAEAATGNRSTYLVFLATPPAPSSMRGAAERLLDEVAPGTSPLKVFDQIGGFAVDLDEAQAARMRMRREVGSFERDRPMRLDPPIPEPQAAPNGANGNVLPEALFSYGNGTASTGELIPWGVRAIWQGRDISTTGNSGAGTYAFVIDSGVALTTGDLIVDQTWSRSFIPGATAFQDGSGHGTHVAGTIGALANGRGVVGVAPGATIISLKVFDSTGGTTYLRVIEAINYAVSVITNNSLPLSKVVINLSLGGPDDSALNAAMINAANLGIRFAVAAGNDAVDANTASPATTGDHPNIFTVSAVASNYVMAPFSNWDQLTAADTTDSVDVAAPGVSVVSLSTLGNGATATLSGTSMAAPHVAGALLMGGVTAGDMATPSSSNLAANFGTAIPADPFAWAAAFPTTTIPTPTPTPSTYTLTPSSASANEGTTLSFAIATTGVTAGTNLYWSLSGTGITTADFTSVTSLLGSSVVQTNGSASINLNINADLLTEGNEGLSVQLYSDLNRSQLVANSTVTLNDTSTTPAPVRPSGAPPATTPSSAALATIGLQASSPLAPRPPILAGARSTC